MKKYFSKKQRGIFLITILIVIIFLGGSKITFAGLVPCGSSENSETCTLCHLIIGFQNIFNFLKNLLFVATILFIVVAGTLYMVSSGNKSLMDWAKKALTYSLTGFILFLCSWLIVTAILTALGYNQVGTWYNFTCDSTSTSTSSSGSGGGTGGGGGSGW
jgi:hypothetical protein